MKPEICKTIAWIVFASGFTCLLAPLAPDREEGDACSLCGSTISTWGWPFRSGGVSLQQDANQPPDQTTELDQGPKSDAPPEGESRPQLNIIEIEGWNVWVADELLRDEHADVRRRALAALQNHLQRVTLIVPEPQLSRLKAVKIRIDLSDSRLSGMQYHPNRGWLERNGHDPRLEKHVHIPQARALYARHMWAKHPYVVLHELAHAYHDQVLGFDDPEIQRVYRAARDSGRYESVLDHRGETVRHYGMNNAKEYFAESTEAWFGVNDFYPFVRAELKQFDPEMHALMQKIWGPMP